jgi:ABC-type sugar transport systems, permease components
MGSKESRTSLRGDEHLSLREHAGYTLFYLPMYSSSRPCPSIPSLGATLHVPRVRRRRRGQSRLRGTGQLREVIHARRRLPALGGPRLPYALSKMSLGAPFGYLMRLGLAKAPVEWLGPRYALLTVVIVGVWEGLGNYVVYFLAGLQRIPAETYESADLDGASRPLRRRARPLRQARPLLRGPRQAHNARPRHRPRRLAHALPPPQELLRAQRSRPWTGQTTRPPTAALGDSRVFPPQLSEGSQRDEARLAAGLSKRVVRTIRSG